MNMEITLVQGVTANIFILFQKGLEVKTREVVDSENVFKYQNDQTIFIPRAMYLKNENHLVPKQFLVTIHGIS